MKLSAALIGSTMAVDHPQPSSAPVDPVEAQGTKKPFKNIHVKDDMYYSPSHLNHLERQVWKQHFVNLVKMNFLGCRHKWFLWCYPAWCSRKSFWTWFRGWCSGMVSDGCRWLSCRTILSYSQLPRTRETYCRYGRYDQWFDALHENGICSKRST